MSEITCPSCQQPFSAVLMVCPHCGTVRGGRPEPSPRARDAQLKGADPSSMRDVRGVTLFLQLLLAAGIVMCVVAVFVHVSYRGLLGELADGTYRGTMQEALDLESRVNLIGVYRLGLYLLVLVMQIIWLFRIYGNLPRLGAERKYKQGWAVGAWLVPFLNLAMPVSLIRESWAKSDPDVETPPPSSSAAPAIIMVWWISWVLVLPIVGNVMTGADDGTLLGLREAVAWWIVGDVAMAATLLMAFPVVRSVAHRQEARGRNLVLAMQRSGV